MIIFIIFSNECNLYEFWCINTIDRSKKLKLGYKWTIFFPSEKYYRRYYLYWSVYANAFVLCLSVSNTTRLMVNPLKLMFSSIIKAYSVLLDSHDWYCSTNVSETVFNPSSDVGFTLGRLCWLCPQRLRWKES